MYLLNLRINIIIINKPYIIKPAKFNDLTNCLINLFIKLINIVVSFYETTMLANS